MASDRDKAVREAAVNKAVEDGATYEWGYHKTAEIAYDLGFAAGKREGQQNDLDALLADYPDIAMYCAQGDHFYVETALGVKCNRCGRLR